jgi:GDP-L-fucose synthase
MKKILLLGSGGFIGSSIDRRFKGRSEFFSFNRNQLNVLNESKLLSVLNETKPNLVINAVGKVGGIQRNIDSPAELMMHNVKTNLSIMNACHELGIRNLIQFASACIYPLNEERGLKESDLGMGLIEQSSKGYAQAKIFGLESYEAFNNQYGYNWQTIIPTNLYGTGDWHTDSGGHVIAMLANKFLNAKKNHHKTVEIWGDGKSLRNFLNIDDLSAAVDAHINLQSPLASVINISGDEELSILELADIIKNIVGFEGEVTLDLSRPNGARRKLLDDSYFRSFGWKPRIKLESGLRNYIKDLNSLIP